MTTVQKIIKYLALALAAFIIINIISGILIGFNAIAIVLGLTNGQTEQTVSLTEITTNIQNEDIEKIKIELLYANLEIKTGDILKIESNSSYISCIQENNQLVIKEKKHNWFAKNISSNQLIIYIPEDMLFETIKIEAGAGEINIENIEAKEISFELGAGKAKIERINAREEAKFEGGAGEVKILSGRINNLDLDMGVGKFEVTSTLIGNTKIDAGIGQIDITLEDNIENYTIEANKGIGSISVDGKEISDGIKYGNGDNSIKINGGIGSIKIKTF